MIFLQASDEERREERKNVPLFYGNNSGHGMRNEDGIRHCIKVVILKVVFSRGVIEGP